MKRKARVVLYSKPGCHLCEVMKQEILNANCSELYALEEVNIDDDPDLSVRYAWDIPVLAIEGTEAFKHRLTAAEFRAALLRGFPQLDSIGN